MKKALLNRIYFFLNHDLILCFSRLVAACKTIRPKPSYCSENSQTIHQQEAALRQDQ